MKAKVKEDGRAEMIEFVVVHRLDDITLAEIMASPNLVMVGHELFVTGAMTVRGGRVSSPIMKRGRA